jgi:phosphopantetheinyl transferase
MTIGARILYATDVLSTDDIRGRVPRCRQSAAAADLLERLVGTEFAPTARSISHSRATVAVAVGDAPGLLLGIDIEWMAPNRPFGAIARTFLASASQQMDCADFYRGWTFFEAYYKAFQCFPDAGLVEDIISQAADVDAYRLADATYVTQHRVADTFQLCLVWHSAASSVHVARI